MTIEIEIVDGETGWPLAQPLDRECYPPEVMADMIWRDVVWAHADWRVFARLNDEIVTHVGLYLRDANDGARPVRICGIGGVMTSPRARKQGYAGAAMHAAKEKMKALKSDFGLLFCEPGNIAFYKRLDWRVFEGAVYCQQPCGRIKFDLMAAMVLPLRTRPESAVIDLCGLPW